MSQSFSGGLATVSNAHTLDRAQKGLFEAVGDAPVRGALAPIQLTFEIAD